MPKQALFDRGVGVVAELCHQVGNHDLMKVYDNHDVGFPFNLYYIDYITVNVLCQIFFCVLLFDLLLQLGRDRDRVVDYLMKAVL